MAPLEGSLALPPLAKDLVSIVVKGNFRPVSISPEQLHDDALIGDVDYRQSAIELLIPGETCVFNAGWLKVQATPDALEFQTDHEEEQERLRDLAVAVLKASGKPIGALGINRQIHFPVSDPIQWHAVGDGLVHNEVWDDTLKASGMRAAIFWGERADSYGGRIQVQIEPSFLERPGVFLAYNDHYDLTFSQRQAASREEAAEISRVDDATVTTEKVEVATNILNDEWSSFLQRTNAVLERIWRIARPEP